MPGAMSAATIKRLIPTNHPSRISPPAGQDALAITRACLERNIILAPGNVFSISQSASRFLRFNVAQSTDPRVITVLQEVLKS